MFPVLVFMYVRLALREERAAAAEFGHAYEEYAQRTPRWIPAFSRISRAESPAS